MNGIFQREEGIYLRCGVYTLNGEDVAEKEPQVTPQDIPVEKQGFAARIERVYPSLPLAERKRTIVFMGDQPISWEMAYKEIRNNTLMGNELGQKLINLKLI